MKFLALIIFVFPFFCNSQSVEVFVDGTSYEFSGGTYDVSSSDMYDVTVDLKIVNQSDSNQNWAIKRILPTSPNWEDQWMVFGNYLDPFGGLVFSIPSDPIWTPGVNLAVPPNDSAYLDLNYHPLSDGCDLFNYYILNNNIHVDSFSINICKTVGLDEVNLNTPDIYPNPTNDLLNVRFPNEVPKSIVLLNTLGKKIATFEASQSMNIPMDKFSEGMYFLLWEIGENKFTEKIQVQ